MKSALISASIFPRTISLTYNAIAGADRAIVVTTAEISAIRDADRIIGSLEANEIREPKLLLNRVREDMVRRGDMISTEDVLEMYVGNTKKINCKIWPQSDTEMIEATFDDYINSEKPFMTYYVTVSGHMAYNWGNAMSKKHKEKLKKYSVVLYDLARLLEGLQIEDANDFVSALSEII